MTRRRELEVLANECVEACLADEVCLSDEECSRVRKHVAKALQAAEREVWLKAAEYCKEIHGGGFTREDADGCGNYDDVATGAVNDEDRFLEQYFRQQAEVGE